MTENDKFSTNKLSNLFTFFMMYRKFENFHQWEKIKIKRFTSVVFKKDKIRWMKKSLSYVQFVLKNKRSIESPYYFLFIPRKNLVSHIHVSGTLELKVVRYDEKKLDRSRWWSRLTKVDSEDEKGGSCAVVESFQISRWSWKYSRHELFREIFFSKNGFNEAVY